MMMVVMIMIVVIMMPVLLYMFMRFVLEVNIIHQHYWDNFVHK